jgi:hypothetical protein
VESEIHEPRIFANIQPACLDGIDVYTRAGIAEQNLLWSSIMERHQFHFGIGSSEGLALAAR